jgi:hypothetical protein
MNAGRPRRSRFLASCQLLLAAFCFLLAILALPHAKGRLSGLFLVFAICCLAAFWSCSGWIVPGTIFGVFFGALVLNPRVKGGTPESQMWETIFCIVMGGTAGLFMGYVIDWPGAMPTSEAGQPGIPPAASVEPGPEKGREQPSA